MIPLPDKKYNIIYADPPWKYPARKNKGTRFGLGAGGHYPPMKTIDICNLPIQDITAETAFLLMWATFPRLEDAFKVMEAWGFKYSTVAFVWVKLSKGKKAIHGPGYYTGSNAEPVLLGRTKDIYTVNSLAASQIIFSPRRKHSKKPDITRDRIIKVFKDKPRIELFARGKVPDGWDAWGDEAA